MALLPTGLRQDVLIECGKPDPRSMTADDPRIVIEILSPSMTRYDRIQKLAEYQQHPTIKVILLVDSEAPQVTVWRGGPNGWTAHEVAGLDASIEMPEIGASLALAELYLDIAFDVAGA